MSRLQSQVSYKQDIKFIILLVRSRINLSIAVSSVSVVCNIACLMVMAFLVQALLSETANNLAIIISLVVMLVLNLTGMYTRLKSADISHFASYDLEYILRSRLTEHISKMPLGEIYRLGQGTLIKVLQEDVKGIHAYVADAPPLMARAILAPVIIVIILSFNYDMGGMPLGRELTYG